MAQLDLDEGGNEGYSYFINKLNLMFAELYAAATGAVAAATGTFSGLLTAASFKLDTGTKTATATAGAATLNKSSGVITTEALTTVAGADYTLVLTNSTIAAADVVLASVQTGSNTTVGLAVHEVVPGANSATIKVRNEHATLALDGTIKISFAVLKA